MRILIATVPFSGHFNPLTGVAARLREEGHDVRWYAAPSFVPRVEALGITAVPFRSANAVTEETLPELFPERARLRGPKLISFEFARVFTDNIPGYVADITELHASWPFERLVCDEAFYAAAILGPKLGVPLHIISPGPSLIPSRDVPPPFFGLRPARNVAVRIVHGAVRRMVHATMKEGLLTFNRARAEAGQAPLKPADLFAWQSAVAVRTYQAGLPETDFPRTDAPANLEYVGSLVPFTSPTAAGPVLERVAAWPGRVVVVSQGTVDNRDHDKLLIPTLAALAHDDVLVVAVTGGVGTEDLRRRFAGPNAVIEDHVDFNALFPLTDLFVSNGGHGSVILALTHGLALVLAGTREGKNDINARLAWNGLACDLRTERPKPAAIAAAATAALADGAMRARVADVARRLAAHDSIDLVVRGVTAVPAPVTGGPV